MEPSNVFSQAASQPSAQGPANALRSGLPLGLQRALFPLYGLALAVSVAVWFIAIRAPFWLDETVSMFAIKGGFSQILSRQVLPGVPAYPVVLLLWTKVMGTSELGLRMLSILAMLGAACFLYLAARELFEQDIAIIAAIFFCLHPIVYVEATDVRPYPFAALSITACILILVRLRHNKSSWLAALFGLSAACTIYFHYLFVVILPALLISFAALKAGEHKTLWRQLGIAALAFGIAFLPVIPGLREMLRTSGAHVFEAAPGLGPLGQVLGQKIPAAIFLVTVMIAAATHHLDLRRPIDLRRVVFCGSLALVPILLLYGISVLTSVHVFVFHYRLVAVPGVALCWALAVGRISSRGLRLLFCLAFVTAASFHYMVTRASRLNNYTWQYALAYVDKDAAADHAPVLVCSDLPESNFEPMPPAQAAKDSALFPPLSYYQISAPIVPMPRALNPEAMRIGAQFLNQAAQNRKRFLAVAYEPSYGTLDWLATQAQKDYTARQLGIFDGIKVLEFVPRVQKSLAG